MSDIEILMKDNSGIGYGYIFEIQKDIYSGEVYQNRLSEKLLKRNSSYSKLVEDIGYGKSYSVGEKSKLDTINEILDFYFIPCIKELPEIKIEKNMKEAIKYLNDNNLNYYIFKLKEKQ